MHAPDPYRVHQCLDHSLDQVSPDQYLGLQFQYQVHLRDQRLDAQASSDQDLVQVNLWDQVDNDQIRVLLSCHDIASGLTFDPERYFVVLVRRC